MSDSQIFPALSREGSLGSSPDCDGRRISPPSKLDKLRFAGFSAEFLDRVSEPNGNIPDKYSLGKYATATMPTI